MKKVRLAFTKTMDLWRQHDIQLPLKGRVRTAQTRIFKVKYPPVEQQDDVSNSQLGVN